MIYQNKTGVPEQVKEIAFTWVLRKKLKQKSRVIDLRRNQSYFNLVTSGKKL